MKIMMMFFYLIFVLHLSATIINIPADQPTIQAGLDVASEGDSVIVAEGIYYENISWPIINGIKLIGMNKENCIIDGGGNGSVIHYEQWDIIHDSTSVIKNFTIQNGLSVNGAGIYLRSENQFLLENLIVRDNICAFPPSSESSANARYSIEGGGGIHLDNFSSPLLRNVQIIQNYSEFDGGGLFIYFSSEPVLENILIANNYTFTNGGGISCESGSNITLNNVTFSDNVASGDGGGIFVFGEGNTTISVTNCIFWNDLSEEIYFDVQSQRTNLITISYSDVQCGEAGIVTNNNGTINWLCGNLDENPLFEDPQNGDYHLTINSPCIDAGNPSLPFDPDGTIADMGAFYYDQGNEADDNQIQLVDITLSNYPNPFNPNTTIAFSIQNDSNIEISIYNNKGQKIKTIAQNDFQKGQHSINWNGYDEFGRPVSSGIYYYKLNVNGKTEAVKKCLLLK